MIKTKISTNQLFNVTTNLRIETNIPLKNLVYGIRK